MMAMRKNSPKPTEKDRIRSILKRQREQMRQARMDRESETVYKDNVCPVCRHRHMTGVICRKWRGNICMKHCFDCEHYEQIFGHCLYHETEPLDARLWKLVFIYPAMLFMLLEDGDERSAVAVLNSIVKTRLSKSYIVHDHRDEVGDYKIMDPKTGEITPYVLKFLADADAWVCVEYLPPGK